MENSLTPSNNQFTPSTRQSTAPAQAMVSRQAQEVQAAMYVAKTFPRDEYDAYNRIMKACDRKALAESAMYEFPRGGTKVTGPSIRLAEVLAQSWGNIDFGVIELEQKNGESSMMAYAWDLETNTRQTKVFTVKHERKARGKVNQLDDPRDIYEMVANQGARRVRACILGVIPGDIVDSAIDRCKETLKNGHKEPLQDRVRNMITIFETQFQVNKAMLEKYIGCGADAFSDNDFIRLSNVYKALRDGMGKREDYFDLKAGRRELNSKTEEAFKQQQLQQPSDNSDGDDSATGTE